MIWEPKQAERRQEQITDILNGKTVSLVVMGYFGNGSRSHDVLDLSSKVDYMISTSL